ncbi:MAG: hypothetical protein IT383_22615 [Deltaproteobacteria bacterium]|nr:hypothetical protein [Deltaproteobacteria bacterium]
MTRAASRIVSLLFVGALGCVVGCAPRYDLFTAWTVGGFSAEEACQQLEAPSVSLRVVNRDVPEGLTTEEITSAECATGTAQLSVASFADLYVDLRDGDHVFGTAGPFALAPASANDGYDGDSAATPLGIDIALQRSRLRAHLTVVGQSCADAGAASFAVAVSRNAAPLEEDVIVQGQAVDCVDGDASFEVSPVDIGVRYAVAATATIGGESYATEAPGEGVVPTAALTAITVDLDSTARP